MAWGQARAALKPGAPVADTIRMRWLSLPLLLLCAAFTTSTSFLPRGSQDFQLAFTRAQVDSAIAARGTEVISRGPAYIACAGSSSRVEFEQYDFASPAAGGESHLWRVWIAFRVPYTRGDFDSLETSLKDDLGQPSEVTEPDPSDVAGVHKLTWVDALTSVQLAARWPEHPDPRADRMLVVWTDRRLQKIVEAQRKEKPKSK
jgi:hypothetical protein